MISGSDVIDPCPISVAADMIVMVPSVAMLIQGFIALRGPSPERAAAFRLFGAAIANVNPAAPIITWRRLSTDALMDLFMSRLPRSAFNRAHDPLVGAAAANVCAHVLDDLRPGGLRFLLKQIGRAHDLTGLAVATLRHALGEPGFLQTDGLNPEKVLRS